MPFDISQTQGETMVRPDGISDYGARKSVPLEPAEIVEIQHSGDLPDFHDAINLTVPDGMGLRVGPEPCAHCLSQQG